MSDGDHPAPGSADAIAEELLAPLTEEQQHVVDLAAVGLRHGKWPIFDYLDGLLEQDGLDAADVLESLPSIGWYGAARWTRAPGQRPAPDEPIKLTVLGLSKTNESAALPIVLAFTRFLNGLASMRIASAPHPEQPRSLKMAWSSGLAEECWRSPGTPMLGAAFVHDLLDGEPCIRSGQPTFTEGGASWEREIPSCIRQFAQIQTVDDYIARIAAYLYQPPAVPAGPAMPSPFTLVAALDYLDTIWRLAEGTKKHLFSYLSAERTAQLVAPAQSSNEFESRLSALAEILRTVGQAVPPPKGRDSPLEGLRSSLIEKLPDSAARISAAVATLHAVIDVRDGTQHTRAATKGARALIALGIGYPPLRWDVAWLSVQARTIEALEVLREELAALAE